MSRRPRAFTLVELLVVIGIIAVLIAILMPALTRANDQARQLRCLSNMRQLAIAWTMYANDSKGKICGSNTPTIGNPKEFNWVTVDTNGRDSLASLQAGVLWKYVNSAGVYHCPNMDYLRTYSINGLLNGEGDPDANTGKIWTTTSQIKHPEATFVFIEEYDNRGYQINSFWVPAYPKSNWVDIPSPFHGRVGLLSFADGHAQMWRWTDPRTWNRKGMFNTNTPNDPDLLDLQFWRGVGGKELPPRHNY
jgi:prepilin-type N-terminal cleavage/methylation domain-containing protein